MVNLISGKNQSNQALRNGFSARFSNRKAFKNKDMSEIPKVILHVNRGLGTFLGTGGWATVGANPETGAQRESAPHTAPSPRRAAP